MPILGPTMDALVVTGAEGAVLGRGEEVDLPLLHESVSRCHARITLTSGAWHVSDLGSTHGTYLNDRRVQAGQPEPLSDGDKLRVGPWTFEVTGAADTTGAQSELAVFKRADSSTADLDRYATRATIFFRLRADDTQSRELGWKEFHDRYAPVIVGFARNAGLAFQEAQDVLQDVLLAFFQASPKFEYDPSKGRFRGYLKRCVLNAIYARRHRVRGQVQADDFVFDERAGRDDDEDRLWEDEWARSILERATDEVRARVDARTFEAFDLYSRRGLAADAVAERLGIGVNSVHQAKSRVMKAIHECVERIRSEEG